MATESPARPVGEIVDRLDSATNQPSLSVHDLLEEFGESSFLPALMVPALLTVSPLSGIPLFSTVCGLTIAFIAEAVQEIEDESLQEEIVGRVEAWLLRRRG